MRGSRAQSTVIQRVYINTARSASIAASPFLSTEQEIARRNMRSACVLASDSQQSPSG